MKRWQWWLTLAVVMWLCAFVLICVGDGLALAALIIGTIAAVQTTEEQKRTKP